MNKKCLECGGLLIPISISSSDDPLTQSGTTSVQVFTTMSGTNFLPPTKDRYSCTQCGCQFSMDEIDGIV